MLCKLFIWKILINWHRINSVDFFFLLIQKNFCLLNRNEMKIIFVYLLQWLFIMNFPEMKLKLICWCSKCLAYYTGFPFWKYDLKNFMLLNWSHITFIPYLSRLICDSKTGLKRPNILNIRYKKYFLRSKAKYLTQLSLSLEINTKW